MKNPHPKKPFSFSNKEKKDILITTAVSTLILFFFFTKIIWRHVDLSVSLVLGHIILLFFITLGVLLLIITVAKFRGRKKGYTVTYQAWYNGLLFGFVISFISDGYVPVLIPGVLYLHSVEHLRFGNYWKGENISSMFWTFGFALITLLFAGVISHMLFFITGLQLFYYIVVVCTMFLFFSLLPFTKSIGVFMFMSKRGWYFYMVFFALFFMIFSILGSFFAVALGFLGSLVLGFIIKKYVGKYLAI